MGTEHWLVILGGKWPEGSRRKLSGMTDVSYIQTSLALLLKAISYSTRSFVAWLLHSFAASQIPVECGPCNDLFWPTNEEATLASVFQVSRRFDWQNRNQQVLFIISELHSSTHAVSVCKPWTEWVAENKMCDCAHGFAPEKEVRWKFASPSKLVTDKDPRKRYVLRWLSSDFQGWPLREHHSSLGLLECSLEPSCPGGHP